MKKKRGYIYILPSLFTTGNLFCGYFSIFKSLESEFEKAIYAILIAGVCDVLDGQVARLTKSQSAFGVEYDSIADVVSFGVAPAALIYFYGLQDFGRLGFSASFFFAACGALRLARFNTLASAEPKSYFVGLPIPAAAGLIASFILLNGSFEISNQKVLGLMLCLFASFLMVSNLRFQSHKSFPFRQYSQFYLLVGVLVGVLFLLVYPEWILFGGFLSYALLGIIREVIFLFGKRTGKTSRTRR